MSTLITASAGSPATTMPTLVLGYEATRESGTRVHKLIGGGVAAVLGMAIPRTGTLRLFYPTRADAFAALNLHARAASFTLANTDIGQVEMTYVVSEGGRVTIALDDQTRAAWVVSVDFQEVP